MENRSAQCQSVGHSGKGNRQEKSCHDCPAQPWARVPYLPYDQTLKPTHTQDIFPCNCTPAFLLRLIRASMELLHAPNCSVPHTKSRINPERRLASFLQERIPQKGESEGSIKSSKRQREEKAGALEFQVYTLSPKANSWKCPPEAKDKLHNAAGRIYWVRSSTGKDSALVRKPAAPNENFPVWQGMVLIHSIPSLGQPQFKIKV